ncbi:hypothetical protein [Streptomyces sp. H51]|uniref:hypothetical protein n=1 Tax=Streptomyces sp. H51 TaxID=3111770 RepID=UPI002D76A0C3|nr:hypothetical protein [Streptomyces sp. H51]
MLAYLTTQRPGLRSDASPETAVWMLVRMVEHLTVRCLLDRPPIPRERFLEELTHLALSHLRPVP